MTCMYLGVDWQEFEDQQRQKRKQMAAELQEAH